ncbi:NYN domain-containing protein [Clavibacter sepedonicus]|uniref:Uncharacterized protein n=1 Tax=Clavibacter sepedonicus TaxID=31964 RepID=B0RJ79_CLASE|nr:MULTISPECIES: NYN domain-containing protein [Clavibacter]MBD5382568.1 NYN domain-containing protein [Clavibacter sp.]OQJ45218.1 hypothetical protein B5P19_15235 [Clavibacter sepedonicus]OQJ50853.1 hypothetical protein B5P20_15570 [Clavibacter sepedonicus]UUK67348.1 NYN domain-containing protein [Clavibacter sepedonicus]CAQ03269.1 hypothetical protein pCSL0024 [Clavibacter sepedonicus]
MATAHLFIDYQNLHFSAWETFTSYGSAVYDSLIHPGKFGDQVLAARAARNFPELELTKIHVYRGLPSRKREPGQHARVQRQASNWTRDPRVVMSLRALKYPRDWPDEPSQEKGIDVLLAIQVVQASIESAADTLIVSTRDTDILPALELVQSTGNTALELATWKGQSELKMSPQPKSVSLDKPFYMRSRDTANYS